MYNTDIIKALEAKASHITHAIFGSEREVFFRDKSERPPDKDTNGQEQAILDWGPEWATIWMSPRQPLHHVFHACLHLYRYWIEAVPQYWDLKQGCHDSLHKIETYFEHLVIVPVEIAYFPEAYSFWINHIEEGLSAFCQEYEPGGLRGELPHDPLRLFWLYALSQSTFPRSQVAEEVRQTVAQLQVLDQFTNLKDRLLDNYEDKAAALIELYRFQRKPVPVTLGIRTIEPRVNGGPQNTTWTALTAPRSMPAPDTNGEKDARSWHVDIVPLAQMRPTSLYLE